MGTDCSKKSKELAKYFKEMSDMLSVHFLAGDKLDLINNKKDFMHLDASSHEKLADYPSKYIKTIV